MAPVALALLGPTASGKSALAMRLAGRLPIEIVSVDSAQVYRGMDIGTAKPSATERGQVPHHLIDLLEPTQIYSAGRFRDDAIAAVQSILGRRRVALLVGGTMLYFRALAQGIDALPAADSALRAAIDAEARQRGWPALHAELARLDPQTARRLDPNDAQRIQRALEVCRASGRPLSALHTAPRAGLPFRLMTVALVPEDRARLHARIAERFERMLRIGLVEELRALRTRYALDASLPSMRCVGYRQAWAHLDGAYDRTTLRDKGVAATRQLAKRQLTWLRAMRFDATLDPFAPTAAQRFEEHAARLLQG